MSDNEIIALRERMTGYGKKPLIVELHQLADEALARGAALAAVKSERGQHDCGCEVCSTVSAVCPATASSYALEIVILRERVAQLETALRWYAATKHWACDVHSGYCDADLDRGEKARAALAVK